MTELVFVDYDVVCHVESCENCDIVIRISAPSENVSFLCGPCSTQIADVRVV